MYAPVLTPGLLEDHLTRSVWPRRVAIMAIHDQSRGGGTSPEIVVRQQLLGSAKTAIGDRKMGVGQYLSKAEMVDRVTCDSVVKRVASAPLIRRRKRVKLTS